MCPSKFKRWETRALEEDPGGPLTPEAGGTRESPVPPAAHIDDQKPRAALPSALPAKIRSYLERLEDLLRKDVDAAREQLRDNFSALSGSNPRAPA